VTGVFVTGTDTGCGKTTVACALARVAARDGLRVRVVKPVETGCEAEGSQLTPLDALALARAAGDPRALDEICPYRFRLPAAPQVAARAEGVEIEMGRIEKLVGMAGAEADLVVVEGAGGLLVPVIPGLDMGDLAGRLGLPLLVVARARLGTINHTRLTLEAAKVRGLRVVGLAVSHTEPDLSPADRANLDLLLQEVPVPVLGELAYGGDAIRPPLDLAGFLSALATG
jgi:dethiobiotin synthetase